MKKIIYYITAITVLLSIMLYHYELPAMDFSNYEYSHRGHFSENVPENSLLSIEKALIEKNGIEIDIRLSKDKHPMVFHDYRLSRMTKEKGVFNTYNKNELQAMHLLTTNQRIPSLETALNLVEGEVPLILDLKGDLMSSTLEDKVIKALEGYKGTVYLQSANPLTNRYLSKHSDYKVGYITISLLPIGDVAFQKLQACLADYISDFDYVALNGKYFHQEELKTLRKHLIWFVHKNRMIRPSGVDNSI